MNDRDSSAVEALQKTWFRGEAKAQIADCQHNELKQKLSELLDSEGIEDFPKVDGFQDSAQILFFDWASHPLLSKHTCPKTVRETQVSHIKQAIKFEEYSIKNMSAFFRESGIRAALEGILS